MSQPEYPDYTTIYTRISDPVPEISLPQFSDAEIATDGSGPKTSNAGEYRILKYGDNNGRKKHLVIIKADVKRKKLLCVEVHIESKRAYRSFNCDGTSFHSCVKWNENKEVLLKWSFRSVIHVQQAPLHWR
ncbi:MAG: hypothetical protein QXU98_08320 [Candidatus Parvarchaeota archaeon]